MNCMHVYVILTTVFCNKYFYSTNAITIVKRKNRQEEVRLTHL